MMKTFASTTQRRRADEGIALIIVLGVLSLLVIIAVGFSITMRVERLAAKSYADSVRGRMLLQGATARVMSDLNAFLADPGAPILLYPDFGGANPRVWPSPDFGSTLPGVASDILTPEVLSFMPVDIRTEVQNAAGSAQWNDLNDADGKLMGQYAFIVADCSGYLDATIADGKSRSYGKNGSEIQMKDVVPEFNGSDQTFREKRTNEWITFESYPELWSLGDFTGAIGSEPENLFVYSRFTPEGRFDAAARKNVNTNRVYIGGDHTDIASKKAEIIQAFNDANVPNASAVYDNLLDYVDPDLEPQDLNSFCTEPVPMINEIVVSNSITKADLGSGIVEYTHDVYVRVETWHPFDSDVTIRLSPAPFSFQMAPAGAAGLTPSTPVSAPGNIAHTPYSYRTNSYHYRGVSQVDPGNNVGVVVTLNGNLDVIENGSGSTVDRVPSAAIPNNALAVAVVGVTGAGFGTPIWTRPPGYKGVSVADPRLNHLNGNGGWNGEPETIGRLNNNASGGEGVSPMYVRNGPIGSAANGSVAELGYLSVGKPWETIALYETPASAMMPVLDYFTIDNNPQPMHGKVNVNTDKEQVLASVFNGLKVEPIPGSNTATVGWAGAKSFAAAIINKTATAPFENISELGDFNRNFFVNTIGAGNAITDADIESVIRKSYELLGIRQNLFTAVIAARIVSPDGTPIVNQKAVAVIWRDPIPNANGHNASFVRFYKPVAE